MTAKCKTCGEVKSKHPIFSKDWREQICKKFISEDVKRCKEHKSLLPCVWCRIDKEKKEMTAKCKTCGHDEILHGFTKGNCYYCSCEKFINADDVREFIKKLKEEIFELEKSNYPFNELTIRSFIDKLSGEELTQ
ncbi:hypothetical protein LCGC14_0729920 [marine sediment metagenome]|uniref:Uncharacterized protein n=1 Tax=marine sediment metagenome TaxID=412755 RepID=A0A0F9SV72_9ZZZZ